MLIKLFFMAQLMVAAAGSPDFNRDIAPLISRRCLECHNEREIKGEVNLTTHEGFTKGTKNGRLPLDLVTQGEMPPKQKGLSQKLPDDEIRLLEEWVESGAAWPSGTLDCSGRAERRRSVKKKSGDISAPEIQKLVRRQECALSLNCHFREFRGSEPPGQALDFLGLLDAQLDELLCLGVCAGLGVDAEDGLGAGSPKHQPGTVLSNVFHAIERLDLGNR